MRSIFSGAALLAIAAAPAPALAQASDPVAAIQSLDDALIALMKSGKPTAARGAAIQPAIDRAYDLPLMTRLAVGTPWTTIAPADQTALVAAFRRMTVAQYAENFSGFSGQSFTIDPKVEARGADRLVRTTLNNPKGSPVAIAYRLRQSGGSWKIIDVFYRNAISQLATRRSDFATVLQTGGAKALIAHLNALAAKAGG
ncbi:ABC transporter substrate-binding protein [Sphingomonas sp.]|uniref:ABC transporter substrate-binding protein n=1 Tax=Sphingomonas sp. TaxID=28214 RepID=UPI002CAE0C89|nr:ABC transporter substrate-binding protein [Sphingomonas sp.]HWK34917.1 ABC transporter substrate-binding protein [Sphingomonas sp.]